MATAHTFSRTNSFATIRTPAHQPLIHLQKGAILRLDGDSRGRTIECRTGRLWISQKGDTSDYLLNPGRSMVIATDGLVIIEALEDSKVALDPNGMIGPMAA